MRVLILRPEPGASSTSTDAAALGLDPVKLPLFEVVPRDWSPPCPSRFAAVAMTSANAARHAGPALSRYLGLPLYAVGAATAMAAHAAGFGKVVAGEGDAATLAALITHDAPGRVLHLAGEDNLALPYEKAETVPVYRSVERAIGAAEKAVITAVSVALVHSPRAGLRFAEICPVRAGVTIIAISAAAAAACSNGWRSVAIADRPRDDAMLALARGLCEAGSVIHDEADR